MKATKTLPPGYRLVGTLNLSKGAGMLLLVNLAALVVLVGAAYLLGLMVVAMRGEEVLASLSLLSMPWQALISLVLMLVVHEALHGLFFWIYTGAPPRFGFKWAYAYAAAPDWYLPRGQYLVVGLAPLFIITVAGVILLWVLPLAALIWAFFPTVMNISGAAGDMVMTVWVLTKPPATLVRDVGDAITAYA